MTRRARTVALSLSGVLLAATIVTMAVVPVPFVRLSPGPVYDALGDVGGQPVVSVTGAKSYPTSGSLGITTVYEQGSPGSHLTLLEAVRGWLSGSQDVLPRDLLFPPDAYHGSDAGDQFQQQGRLQLEESEQSAVVAALRFVGEPVTFTVVVDSTEPGTPADGVLLAGDVLVKVNGQRVGSYRDVKSAMSHVAPGDDVTVTVRRDGHLREFTMTTVPNPDDKSRAYLGVAMTLGYHSPVDVELALSNVGGPSAGLMFSLATVDTLTPGSLTSGSAVAGTGTITPTGRVGAIGGIVQKMYGARANGATLFLAPEANCREVAGNEPSGLTVAAVSSLEQAVAVLEGRQDAAPCR